MLATALTGCFAAICVFSAAVQYNDPDPARWIAIYLAAGVAAVVVLARPRLWWIAAVAALAAGAWAAALWAGVAGHVQLGDAVRKMSEKGGKVEELREAGGLTIAAVGAALATWYARRRAARLD